MNYFQVQNYFSQISGVQAHSKWAKMHDHYVFREITYMDM